MYEWRFDILFYYPIICMIGFLIFILLIKWLIARDYKKEYVEYCEHMELLNRKPMSFNEFMEIVDFCKENE